MSNTQKTERVEYMLSWLDKSDQWWPVSVHTDLEEAREEKRKMEARMPEMLFRILKTTTTTEVVE